MDPKGPSLGGKAVVRWFVIMNNLGQGGRYAETSFLLPIYTACGFITHF